MMVWWYISAFASWLFHWVLRGHFGALENIPPCSDGKPRSTSVAVNYIQIFHFTGTSMPHQHGHNIPSSISVSVPPPLFSALAQERKQCQNTATSNTIERLLEGQTERERESRERWGDRQNYSPGQNLIVNQRKLREKKFLLNWLWIHEKQTHNASLTMCH